MNATRFDLLIVRHGLTDENVNGVLQGQSPTSLNETGRRQADLLATRLAAFAPSIGLVLCSDLPRARQTAEPFLACSAARSLFDPAWRERAFGDFEGRPLHDWEAFRSVSPSGDPPGGETAHAFLLRVRQAFLAATAHAREHEVIAVVTHGGVCRALLRLLALGDLPCEGTPPPDPPPPVLNGSILHVSARHDAGGAAAFRVIRVNDVDHLGGLGRLDGLGGSSGSAAGGSGSQGGLAALPPR